MCKCLSVNATLERAISTKTSQNKQHADGSSSTLPKEAPGSSNPQIMSGLVPNGFQSEFQSLLEDYKESHKALVESEREKAQQLEQVRIQKALLDANAAKLKVCHSFLPSPFLYFSFVPAGTSPNKL